MLQTIKEKKGLCKKNTSREASPIVQKKKRKKEKQFQTKRK